MWKPTICRSFFEGNHIVFPHRWFTLGYIHRFESPHIHEHHLSTRLRLQATNFVFSGLSTRRPDDVALSMGYHEIPRNLGRNLGRIHQLCQLYHGNPWISMVPCAVSGLFRRSSTPQRPRDAAWRVSMVSWRVHNQGTEAYRG